MSDATREKYGKYIDFITSYTPGLTILTLTPSDLGIDFTEKDKENVAVLSLCPPNMQAQTEDMVNTILKVEAAQDRIQAMLVGHSETEDPIIPKEVLVATLLNNNRELSEYIGTAAAAALTGEASALSLNRVLYNNDQNIAIIAMPDKFDYQSNLKGMSGISGAYFNSLKSTEDDFLFDKLGHEIAGHAYHQHNYDNLGADYNCVTINSTWLDQSNEGEAIGDIMGSFIHREAQSAGLASKANTPEEIAALRALGNLYIGNNAATYANTQHVNDHVTTLTFDPKSPEFRSNLDTTGTSTLPPLINRVADAISGYVSTLDFKKEMKANPKNYTEEQHTFFSSLSDDPGDFAEHIDDFARLGEDLRLGMPAVEGMDEIKPKPEWHYAAIAFIHKHDLLKTVREETAPAYGQAMDDLITDFLAAADKYAKKLKDQSIEQKIDSALKPEHYTFLNFNAFIGLPEETVAAPQTPEI